MAELIVSPLLDVIFGNLASAAMEELRLVRGVDKELNKLKGTLSAIQDVLEDAEDRQIESVSVKNWLGKLQDVAYEADDLVDEIATETQQQSMIESRTEAGKKIKQQVCNFVSSCFSGTQVGQRRELAHRIREINEQLDEIAKQKADFHLQDRSGSKQMERRPLASSVKDESEVFGREDDRKQVIESLLSDDSGNRRKFSVTAIVGMGGQGKTTLAQVVYNDERVRTKFEVRAWVCVSENFDVERLTKEILETAGEKSNDLLGIDALQCRLRDVLNGKRFLLVLDDMWNEKPGNWETLEAPFAFGAKGSKILVTARNRAVSDIMQPTRTHNLERLSPEDCWKLFVSRAFADGKDINDYPLLEETGKKIVGKCQGLPLAVKAVGGLLSRTREAREWENILNSTAWHRHGVDAGISPSLRVSYQHLPVHLKRCFTFCSIYPKDYRLVKAELIRMWIAHGFIRAEDGEQIEDTGSRYFNDLVQSSFFQYSSSFYCHTMHDLLHDLAQSISGKECFYMDGPKPNGVPQKTRHLSLNLNSGGERANFETLYESKGLRTLLLRNSDYKVPHDMFNRLGSIRVLKLANCGVPASIGNLRHLRYLKLEDSSIRELPESICTIYNLQALILVGCLELGKLPDSIGNLRRLRHLELKQCYNITELPESVCSIYNLQTLILSSCSKLVKLPNETSKLINLRHLNLDSFYVLKSMPPGIGRLTCLQTLSRFIVGREPEKSIAELKELAGLSGDFKITNLENVEEAGEARQANLKSKRFIDELTLRWSSGHDVSSQDERLQEEVAEELQPHANLKTLSIHGYMGTCFPSWMMKRASDVLFPHLTAVELEGCRRCTILPPLGELPSLVDLSIIRMDELKQLEEGHFLRLRRLRMYKCPQLISLPQCPSIEELHLSELDNLENWSGVALRLRRLGIHKCPQLISLPQCPSLEELHLSSLDNLENWSRVALRLRCLRMYNCPQLISLPQCPSLEELHLEALDNLEEWCGDGEADFRSLRELSVKECPKMMEWPDSLSALTELSVSRCRGFDAVPLFPSLRRLRIGECSDRLRNSVSRLTSLSSLSFEHLELTSVHRGILQTLIQLKQLIIFGCDKVETLLEEKGLQNGALPLSLTHLTFTGCSNLKSLPRGLHALTSLQTLGIFHCPHVTSLPEEGLPAGLQSLEIFECPRLVERCQKDNGEDWPKISHIRNVRLY